MPLYIPFILFSLLLGCKQVTDATPKTTPKENPEGKLQISRETLSKNNLKLVSLKNRYFPEVIRVNGMIDVPPENRVTISAIYGGFIKNTYLLVGDTVRKGQLLVSLENPEFINLQQQYLELSAQIPYLESEYKRQQTLFEEKITSQKLFLKAESDYNTATTRQKSLRAQLQMLGVKPEALLSGELQSTLPIYAPMDGKVTRINIRKGAFVSQATEILEIVNQDHLHLELTVFEKDVNRLSKGQEIQFSLPEVSQDRFKGSIYLIGSTIDENRTVKVHGHLETESDNPFLVGMYVQADIFLEVKDSETAQTSSLPALPAAALGNFEDQNFVWILYTENEDALFFRKVPVETGVKFKGFCSLQGSVPIGPDEQVLVGSVEFPIPLR